MLFILKALTKMAHIVTRTRSKLARALCVRSERTSEKLQQRSIDVYRGSVRAHAALHAKHDAELEALRTKQAKVRDKHDAALADLEASLIEAANRAHSRASEYAMYING